MIRAQSGLFGRTDRRIAADVAGTLFLLASVQPSHASMSELSVRTSSGHLSVGVAADDDKTLNQLMGLFTTYAAFAPADPVPKDQDPDRYVVLTVLTGEGILDGPRLSSKALAMFQGSVLQPIERSSFPETSCGLVVLTKPSVTYYIVAADAKFLPEGVSYATCMAFGLWAVHFGNIDDFDTGHWTDRYLTLLDGIKAGAPLMQPVWKSRADTQTPENQD